MRLVSPLLKRAVYPALARTGVLRRLAPSGLAVLTYHGVLPSGYQLIDAAFDGNLVRPEVLRQQLRLLKLGYNVISPEDVLAWTKGDGLPERAVLITCDDGLLNHLTDMLPVLQQESVKCLFFVTGASAGTERLMLWYEDLFLCLVHAPQQRFHISYGAFEIDGTLGSREERRSLWWSIVKQLSQYESETRWKYLAALKERLQSTTSLDLKDMPNARRFGLMLDDELRQLSAAGMTIGAHTMSHPVLSQMPLDTAFAEIVESRSQLQSALNNPVWAFAYPFGDARSVTPGVLSLPKQAGFDAAFLNHGGGLGTSLTHFALPRIHVTFEMNLSELEAHVSGIHARLQSFARGRAGAY